MARLTFELKIALRTASSCVSVPSSAPWILIYGSRVEMILGEEAPKLGEMDTELRLIRKHVPKSLVRANRLHPYRSISPLISVP